MCSLIGPNRNVGADGFDILEKKSELVFSICAGNYSRLAA